MDGTDGLRYVAGSIPRMTTVAVSSSTGPPIVTPSPILALDRLEVRYPTFHLHPLSLALNPGQRVALVGPNGAGKSTTMKALAGRLPAYDGAVLLRGEEMRAQLPEARAEIGFLPEVLGAYGWMTVAEHLAFLATFYPTWDAGYAGDLAQRLGLPLGDKVGTLSKGTKVKLAFVAAESFRPPVLLLDEPTSGLDPVVRREVIDGILERFPDAGGRLVVFSTHILEDVEGLAERVVVLIDGTLRRDAAVAELRREHPHETLSNILYGILTNGTPPTRRAADG